MTRGPARLFIERRPMIPHDGTRRAIADGYVKRQDTGARVADDRLASGLADALAEEPGVSAVIGAGLAAWEQRGGRDA